MIDYIKFKLRNKADIIILNCGSNDITNDMNTAKEMRKLAKEFEEYDRHSNFGIE